MTLSPGTQLGPYEIQNAIGAGGMGEVYGARDTKLDRMVAIKVLPEEVSGNAERLSRFEREAKAVAALSHPNILAIHDFGKENGTVYAVMELLEGETLKERLGVGAVAERKAVEIAAQMARGLGAAHEKSIVHRDLKPDNVFITEDGRVKLLDFGLAKITVPEVATTSAKTLGSSTDPGKVMGTVGYMSPEQVRGEPADHRSDIFSFGILLYEMLAGRRAFERDTAVETMNAILREEPEDLTLSGTQVPAALDRVVRRCLEKKPGERFQSARDLAFALENASGTSVSDFLAGPAVPARPARNRVWRTIPWAVVFGLGVLTGLALFSRVHSPGSTEPAHIRPLTFSGRDFEPSASPDGRLVAFRSDRDGVSRIWVKQLTGGGEAPLTEGVDALPRFSPDGSQILFLHSEGTQSSAYRVALVGGEPRKLIDNVTEAVWSPDGTRIGFMRSEGGGGTRRVILGVTNDRGGEEKEVFETNYNLYASLQWSPDGRRLAVIQGSPAGNRPDSVLIVDVDSGESTKICTAESRTPMSGLTWTGDNRHVLFGQSGSLIGDQSGALTRVLLYDLNTSKETTLFWASGLMPAGGPAASFSILSPGVLVFDEARLSQNLLEFRLDGVPDGQGRQWARGQGRDRQPTYSPDGKLVLFSSNRSGNLDLWTLSTETGAVRQLTDDAAQDWDPAFTPDGGHILWSSDRGGNLEIWIANADGSGARQLSRDGRDAENPTGTPDGWVVYWSAHPDKRGPWKIRIDGTEATRLLDGEFYGTDVSPDGRHTVCVSLDDADFKNTIHVVDVETGAMVPFEIQVPYRLGSVTVVWGRSRWLPDGSAIAYIGENDDGLTGVFVQDFVPGKDTSASRRQLAGFSPDYISESFGISPDGTRVTLSIINETYSLMLAEGLPREVTPPWPGVN